MDRRKLILAATYALGTGLPSISSAQAPDPLDAILKELDENPDIVTQALAFQDKSVSRGVGHGHPNPQPISERAQNVIRCFEVSGEKVYTKKFQVPVYPGLGSGATIGIGYDLRFASYADLQRDWGQHLRDQHIDRLIPYLGKSGPQSFERIPALSDFAIPWSKAKSQFAQFLPYQATATLRAFPNAKTLSPTRFGALVSLVYNRGPNINRNAPNRAGMYEIRRLSDAAQWDAIPEQLRLMKNIWLNKKNGKGLVLRREAEAVLFETGANA
jgi:GH24 family phage-related lysozyme (muramidase)